MKNIILLVLMLMFSSAINAAPIQYRFVGENLEPEIDFTLEIDFSLNGYFTNSNGSLGEFDASRNTFLVTYISGNYTSSPTTNLFSSNYGEDSNTVEGIKGCMYALNSIGVCTFGSASNWSVGSSLNLSLFDSMGSYDTVVRLESISAVPLPASFFLFISGIASLIGFKKYNK